MSSRWALGCAVKGVRVPCRRQGLKVARRRLGGGKAWRQREVPEAAGRSRMDRAINTVRHDGRRELDDGKELGDG